MNTPIKQNMLQVCTPYLVNVVSLFLQALSASVGGVLLLISVNTQATVQVSEEPQISSYECTHVSLDGVSEDLLTKQERIALLDESLSESIDSYSTCVNTAAQNMAGGGAGQEGGTGETSDASQAEQTDTAQAQTNAQQTSQIQGAGMEGNEQGSHVNQQNTTNKQSNIAAARGIIPPADNDKIICKLLYQEITKTQDPDMIDGLRQQYSNYNCGK